MDFDKEYERARLLQPPLDDFVKAIAEFLEKLWESLRKLWDAVRSLFGRLWRRAKEIYRYWFGGVLISEFTGGASGEAREVFGRTAPNFVAPAEEEALETFGENDSG